MVMSILPFPHQLVVLAQFGYPLLCSLDQLKPSETAPAEVDIAQWSLYWPLCVLWMTLESQFLWWLVEYLPLYLELKLVFFVWLVHPTYKGAAYLWYGKLQSLHKALDDELYPRLVGFMDKAQSAHEAHKAKSNASQPKASDKSEVIHGLLLSEGTEDKALLSEGTEDKASGRNLEDKKVDNTVLVEDKDQGHAEATPDRAAVAAVNRAVFLDVDGVLHDVDWDEEEDMLTADRLRRLESIVSAGCGATLVLSSSWREDKGLLKMLRKAMATHTPNLDTIVEMTPVIAAPDERIGLRAHEILEWLRNHPQVKYFVAIDDKHLAQELEEGTDSLPGDVKLAKGFSVHFVQTESSIGLTDNHVDCALAKLAIPMWREHLTV